ncbi:hypothetical protein, conserved, partial [Eimeria tenella]
NPSRLDYVFDFGRLLAKGNKREKLKALAEKCRTITPTAVGSLQVYGHLKRLEGAPQEAVQLLHAATALDPTSGECWSQLGSAYLELGDLLSAAKAFAAAAAAAPAAAAARIGAGQTQALLLNWAAAERQYAAAVKCRPDLPTTWWHLGIAQKQQNKIALALKSFQQCWFLSQSSEAAAECFGCAMLLRSSDSVGPLTLALWAERLVEGFVFN